MSRAVVIGVGNEYRHDDGVGLAVLAELDANPIPGVVTVLCDGEPAALLEAWTGAELAVVVDAVLCEPSTPGRIWRSTVDGLPSSRGTASSHALGIPDAVRLGAALGRVPDELVVYAIEAAELDLGVGLTPAVQAAVPEVVRAIRGEFGC
ncbi:hydrogenase maturation protease [Amycolatopsis sp. MtRt-6]|uniref:hydrogenase maturation protease n=1 Tax=Amycolatopsis sp. MtRt-6 TaxID=2792782 RepID=UPI001A8DB19F|nr:hydrogenase maturation protease [Amycolatopsis sp. MtRt-6]